MIGWTSGKALTQYQYYGSPGFESYTVWCARAPLVWLTGTDGVADTVRIKMAILSVHVSIIYNLIYNLKELEMFIMSNHMQLNKLPETLRTVVLDDITRTSRARKLFV